MGEAIPRRQGAIGQLRFAERLDQAVHPIEAIEPLLQGDVVRPQQPREYRRGELLALDGRILERLAVLLGEQLDLLGDHAADALRGLQSDLRQWPRQPPALAFLRDITPLDEELDEAGREQGMPFGLAQRSAGNSRGKSLGVKRASR